ncbi:MAG: RimK/LysX family protein [Pseudomonadota bacterium]
MTHVDAHAGKNGPTRQVAQIGWREWVGLPRLGVARIKAKIDTGARTAALHAEEVETFERDGAPWVRFKIASGEDGTDLISCEAPVADKREIRNTSGVPEERYIINTSLRLGTRRWSIELSLANRAQMGFELILGRTAIRRRKLVVNPGRSFLAGEPKKP